MVPLIFFFSECDMLGIKNFEDESGNAKPDVGS